MLLRDDDTVLWLRDQKELQTKPPPTHAILWPALEYTALVRAEIGDTTDHKLDPFQRAVLGLARNGITQIAMQADLLDLHPGFVAHIQDRLRTEVLIDDSGRPRVTSSHVAKSTATAVRLYQDPFTGMLWPCYVTEARRRSLPIEDGEHGPRVDGGTTGDPVPIRVFVVLPHEHRPPPPTADDARAAIQDWSRSLRQQRAERQQIVDDGPVQLITESPQHVYLCCPNGRTSSREPDVADPFGGSSNRPFLRAIADQAATLEPLGRWIYGDAATVLASAPDDAGSSLTGQLGTVISQLQTETARIGSRRQLGQDIDLIGHRAIDELWASGTEQIENVAVGLIADRTLLDAFSVQYGFGPRTVPAIADLRAICSGKSAPLAERAAALLMRFRPDIAGPLHRVAPRCPDLYQLLGESDASGSIRGLEQRSTAVFALAEEADRLTPDPIPTTGAADEQE